ncbi:oligosaccharide flippase family protein [Parabacteroides sp.]|uniref:lipopolysaccharide biosynthesis protein n=1 Tax=Parabacteroides sp. TaxID=1869337 RepID=UPI00257FB507|nr:oligosaccharide flippase family protein [Parabacteroides sp.]
MLRKLDKIKKIPNNIKATFVFAIASFATSGINYITTPIFTRLLSTSEYGLISVYNSWFEIVRVFASLTLIFPGILNVGLYENSNNRWKYLSSMLGMTATSTMFLAFLYAFFCEQINSILNLPTSLMILMILMCFFQPATIFWTQKQRYEIKYKITFFVSVGSAVAAQIISVLCVVWLKKTEINLAIVRLWSTGITNIFVALYLYVYICKKGERYIDYSLWRRTVFVAIPLIPHYLSTVVLSSTDKIMIGQMVSQSKTGIYSLAAILSAMGVLIWRALSVTYTPFVNKKLGERNFQQIRDAVKPLLFVVGAFCIMTALAGPEIISVLATPEYYEGVYVVPPIAASIFTTALYDNITAISFFHKKSINIMLATVVAAISNIVLNYIFIKQFGYIAAGYTTLISHLILTGLHYMNSRKIEPEKIYDSKYCLVSVIVITVVCLFCNLLYGYTWIRYILILITLIVIYQQRNKIIAVISSMKA